MSDLLVFVKSEDAETVNNEVVKKISTENQKVYVVIKNGCTDHKSIPDNWKIVNFQEIQNFYFAIYIHAVENEFSLITKQKWSEVYTICMGKSKSHQISRSFDLKVMVSNQFVISEKALAFLKSNTVSEIVIDMNNKTLINQFTNMKFKKENRPNIIKLLSMDNSINVLKISRQNGNIRALLQNLVSNDYTLVQNQDKENVFVQRSSLSKFLPKMVLNQNIRKYYEVFYTIEKKIKRDANAPQRLIVIFSSMPSESAYFSSNFLDRTFVKHFPTIQNLVVPNTHVLRIVDSNLMYGSHYVNSVNFPNYERRIQGLINKVSKNLLVKKENIVLYGTSKGGTGALVHSLIGNYKSVSIDPIINANEYNNKMRDIHFIKNNRTQSLVTKINELKSGGNNNIVIRSPQVHFNYQITHQLKNSRIQFYDQKNSSIKNHKEIGRNSVSEILMFLNAQLLGLTICMEQ
ncbi:XcbB/CpsF family capsular polysaccharide biosynthesis protein [Leuconostoc mesenteroides]|uniref:XcbB/CpsF family capsular polysaccharide biosynthesis protein n=1 Tax=Leuconostoc mesenteroides TaxID=1245 RepID=UPI00107F985C|nr:XcbB/CpsF family capsular polysaccharide biosynthesis protein [Leuconostoc mesenteroides]TGD34755.1 hypothetical protein EIA53_04340 [Leuconostoc mesenteroides]